MSSLSSRLSLSLAAAVVTTAALGGCAMACRACGAKCGTSKTMPKCSACKAKCGACAPKK
ncbi:MAG: hypothetical protein AB7S86_13600 [Hydrogenophaga sp.]|uniref:hypothetical protein n=1 Tax=Hydrogenophaga sp. TaxID=1904254 RepID=UPI003D124650